MKKIIIIMLAVMMAFTFIGCSKNSEPVDLTGEWVQSNSNSKDSWQAATISENEIEINWITDNGDTKSLYWYGTYTAPTETADSYSWISKNDTSKTNSALLASRDKTKKFKYENGIISYEVSALGTTTTVKLERKDK